MRNGNTFLNSAKGRKRQACCWGRIPGDNSRAITHLRWVQCSAPIVPYLPARRTQSPPVLQSGHTDRTHWFGQGASLCGGKKCKANQVEMVCLERECPEMISLLYTETKNRNRARKRASCCMFTESGPPSGSQSPNRFSKGFLATKCLELQTKYH